MAPPHNLPPVCPNCSGARHIPASCPRVVEVQGNLIGHAAHAFALGPVSQQRPRHPPHNPSRVAPGGREPFKKRTRRRRKKRPAAAATAAADPAAVLVTAAPPAASSPVPASAEDALALVARILAGFPQLATAVQVLAHRARMGDSELDPIRPLVNLPPSKEDPEPYIKEEQ